MHFIVLLCFIYFDMSESVLWPKGVVHYAINQKDYDLHSQDEIVAAFAAAEKEICVKFFSTPMNFNSTDTQKVLFINNPEKQKDCRPQYYNFTGNVVDMIIGYKCINKKDIARMTVDMLKASIKQSTSMINSYDLVKQFEAQVDAKERATFLTTKDRNYINAHYHKECSQLTSPVAPPVNSRRSEQRVSVMTPANEQFYAGKTWPMGVVMYVVEDQLRNSSDYKKLVFAMTQIESTTCVLFHESHVTDNYSPNNYLSFRSDGAEDPELGFKAGEQALDLRAFTTGAAGHDAHATSNLMRALGIPMMSNRYDRDNYLTVLWSRVRKGKERLLEKTPQDAWLTNLPYDFSSVTHAPVNYLCGNCKPGENTVQPLQDYMWRRTLEMGHHSQLSDSDKATIAAVYSKQCAERSLRASEN